MADELITDPWHQQKGDDMAQAIDTVVSDLKKNQAGRKANYIRNLQLFEKRALGGSYTAHGYDSDFDDKTIWPLDRLGLIRSAVETAVANIYAQQKPKPQFQTLGATWELRRKAYRLDRICEGILNQRQGRWINVWAFMIDAVTDAALHGDACVKVVADTERKRIVHKLIPSVELFVDPSEGREPNNLFQREPIDAYVAAKLWPKASAAIHSAPQYDWYGKGVMSRPRASKVIELKYAWRLPFGEDQPGKWAAVINGKLLESGEWTAPMFPFVFVQWEPHRDGFWASGIGDTGRRLAEDAGDIHIRLKERAVVAAGKRVYYQEGTVKPEDLELNDAVVGIAYSGGNTPSESLTPPFTPSELQYLQYLTQTFWDAEGISAVSAAARREQGIESGVAMMTLNDTKASRQLVKSQRYEQAFVDLAHQYVWRLRELAEEDDSFTVTWPGKTLLRQEKWKDADIEDELFTVNVAPASALPHDPAGRQQMVSDLLQAQMISKDTAKQLIGWPDLDSELSVENSEFEYIDMLIEKYLDAEQKTWKPADYQGPEGFIINKVGALRRFIAAWFRARIDQNGLPADEQAKAEFNIRLIKNWIMDMDKLIAPPEQMAAAEGMQGEAPEPLPRRGGGGAGGQPGAPLPPSPLNGQEAA